MHPEDHLWQLMEPLEDKEVREKALVSGNIKITAVFDGLKFSQSTKDYAIYLARQQRNVHLTGVFIEDFTYHSYKIPDLLENNEFFPSKRDVLDAQDHELREESVKQFERECRKAAVDFNIHRDRDMAMQELIHESIYADLMVINGNESFNQAKGSMQGSILRNLLSEAQCPLLVVPDHFRPIEKAVFLFDGDPAAIFAGKMFGYLMDGFHHLPTEILAVTDRKDKPLPGDDRLMKEFTGRHYPGATQTRFKGEAETEIISYLRKRDENIMVILGVYRRGLVSRWLKPAMADYLMKDLHIPLFIAHNR